MVFSTARLPVPPGAAAGSTFLLTFYRAGSQWTRDLLTDPLVAVHSGAPLSLQGVDLLSAPWPEAQHSTFVGPLYGASREDWCRFRRPGDRAIVVLRDPRDLIVSLVAAIAFSHAPTPTTALLRDPLRALPPRERLQVGLYCFALWEPAMRSWRQPGTDGALVTTYEKLVGPGKVEELTRIFRFLGWEVPASSVDRLLAKHSFEQRSGRPRGSRNDFSYWRSGVPGAWREAFDRALGRLFEESFPQLLSQLGYEAGSDWPQTLGDHPPSPERTTEAPLLEALETLAADVESLRRQLDAARQASLPMLPADGADGTADVWKQVLATVLADAEQWRLAAEDRERHLQGWPRLWEQQRSRAEAWQRAAQEREAHLCQWQAWLQQRTAEKERWRIAAEERQRDLLAWRQLLQDQISQTQQWRRAAEEREASLHRAQRALEKIYSSAAYRIGFRAVARLGRLLNRVR